MDPQQSYPQRGVGATSQPGPGPHKDYYVSSRGGHDAYQQPSGQHSMKYAYPPSEFDGGVQQQQQVQRTPYADPSGGGSYSQGGRADLSRSHGYTDAVFGGAASELYVTPSERNAGPQEGFAYRNYTQLSQGQQQQQQQQHQTTKGKVGASELQPVIPGQQQNINSVQHPHRHGQQQSHVALQQEQLQEMYRRQQQQAQAPAGAPQQQQQRGLQQQQQQQPVQAIQGTPTSAHDGASRAEKYQAYPSHGSSMAPPTPTEAVTGNATQMLQQLDNELRESQEREKKLKAKLIAAAESEKQHLALREQHAQLARHAEASKQQQQQGNTVLKALEDKVRSLSTERDALNSQLDELMGRHNILQRSLHDIDQRKMLESDNTKLLQTQNVTLTEEVHNLRAAKESADKAAQKALKELQIEFLTMKKQYVQLQADHEDETSTLASRLTVERDDAIKRLYDAEQKHVILSSQFNETEDKCRWLSEQVRNLEVSSKAAQEQHGRDLSMRVSAAAKAEEDLKAEAERAAAASVARQEERRLAHLYSLLKTLSNRWTKRFFRNHLLGWFHAVSDRNKAAAELAEADRMEGLKNILGEWLATSRRAKADRQLAAAIAESEGKHSAERKAEVERLSGEHGESMAEAARRHEGELDALREKMSADLKKSRDTLLDELQSGREIHRSELERLAERGANEIRELRKQHSSEASAQKDKFEAMRLALETERSDAVARLEAEKAEATQRLESERDDKCAALRAEAERRDKEATLSHEATRARMEAEASSLQQRLEGERDAVKARLQGQVDSLRVESQQAAQKAAAALSDEVQRAAGELEASRKAHADDVAATTASFEARIRSMEEGAAAERRLLEESGAAKVKSLEEAHQAASKVASEEMSKLVRSHSATVAAMQEEARGEAQRAAKALDDTRSALQAQLTTLEKETSQQIAAKEASCASRVSAAEAERNAKVSAAEAERDSRVKELTEVHEAAIVALKNAAAKREEEQKQQLLDEQDAWFKEKENLQWQHSETVGKLQQDCENEVQKLKDDATEMEANLRAQMVADKAKSDQESEEARSTWARREEELRKRVLEKEKDIARHMQEAEEERQRAVDQGEEELKELQKECDRKLDAMRGEHAKATEDLRGKMHSKEKDLMGRIESLRSDNIRAQEQFQSDLQDKEASFQRRLEQEKSLQAQVDNLMSSTSVKELQAKISSLSEQLRAKQDDCDATAERETDARKELESQVAEANRLAFQLEEAHSASYDLSGRMEGKQSELDGLEAKNSELSARLEETIGLLRESREVQTNLACQFEGSSGELEKARMMQRESQEATVAAQREATKYQAECRRLDKELQEASQALLKRGDEFSETMSLLQGRFDAENREIQEKLRVSNATNVRLASELEESSTLLLKIKDQTTGTQQAVEDLYKKKLAAAEQELKQANDTYQDRLSKASSASQSELQRKLGEASSRVQQAEERASCLEKEVERAQMQMQQQQISLPAEGDMLDLQRRLERVERENDTLTEELDNCLAENAQLRSEIDSRVAGSPSTVSNDDDMSSAASSYGHKRIHTLRSSVSSTGTTGRAGGASLGVHTVRLLRAAYLSWLDVTVENRMLGRRPMFSGLDYFQGPEGSLAEWFPVGRIRRSELEIKTDKLGSGSFAEVYRGEFKLPVAVKKIKGSVQQRELLEFVREGEMLRCVSHPCIVKLLGVYQEGQTYSLVQECVCGVNIFDYLHIYHKTVPIGKQIGVALQICDALAYLHSLRIVHRDVKPQNVIYLDKSGTAKLCDFGLARLIPVGVELVDPVTLGTGGTPAYQAPEVLKRTQAGRKLDLYGFAVTLWEMYTTKLPWSDCNLDQMTHRVVAKNERPPMPQDMPRGYADVIARSWEKDPARRPEFSDILSTLRDMYEALNPAQLGRVHSSTSSLGCISNASTSSQRSSAPQQHQQPHQRPAAPTKLVTSNQQKQQQQQQQRSGYSHSGGNTPTSAGSHGGGSSLASFGPF